MNMQAYNVSGWRVDDEHAVFPIGARDKELLWSPSALSCGLKPDWSYLFKQSRRAFPDQFWMETVAHLVGQAMGIQVPKALPAFKISQDEGVICGSVIEWFYKRDYQTFVHAADYYQKLIPSFDTHRGTQHNIDDLITFCRVFKRYQTLSPNWEEWLWELLLFDAFIGNSDRHQENWGFIFDPPPKDNTKRRVYLSPLFDNGSSLGHERFPNRVMDWGSKRLDEYINRGCHHLRSSRDDPNSRIGHIEGLKKLSQINPKAHEWMLGKMDFDLDSLLASIRQLCDTDIAVPFTVERAEWTIRLLTRRHHLIMKILQNV